MSRYMKPFAASLLAIAGAFLGARCAAEVWPPPQAVTTVPVVILVEGAEQGYLTTNKIGLFPEELPLLCLAKQTDTEALCFIMQPNGVVYSTKRRLRAVPA